MRREEIADARAQHPELADLCSALIDLANERGGPDNITVVAAHFEGDGLAEPSASEDVGYSVYHLPDGEVPGRGADDRADRHAGGDRAAAHAAQQPDARAAPDGRRALPHRRPARGLALTSPTEARLGTRLSWVAALSFASGLPYFFFTETVPVWLAASGMSLAGIGLASGASLPWVLKFLWAPVVDRIGSRRLWIRVCLGLLALTTAAFSGADPARHAGVLAALLLLYVTLSATQDIAIDAYTIEITHGRELGVANSVRIAAYRGASFVSSALLVWVAARYGWTGAYLGGAVLLGTLAAATLVLPSPAARERASRDPGRAHPRAARAARRLGRDPVRPALQARHLGHGADDQAVLGRARDSHSTRSRHSPPAGCSRPSPAPRSAASSRRGSASFMGCGRWDWCSCSRAWATPRPRRAASARTRSPRRRCSRISPPALARRRFSPS